MASYQPERRDRQGSNRVDSQPSGLDVLANLVLDRHAEVPLGVQLAWALRARIGEGRLAPGQRLPGLRDLADSLGINANTVRAVYQRLEHEGIVVSQQGSGTFVANASPSPSAVGAIVASAAQEAQDTGVDPRDVAAALYVVPKSSTARSTGAQAARSRQLRTQIAALELTLGELEARHPAFVAKPSEGPSVAGPRLLDVPELERVQNHLVSRLATLHAAIDQLGREPPADPDQRPLAPAAPKRATAAHAKTRPAPAGA